MHVSLRAVSLGSVCSQPVSLLSAFLVDVSPHAARQRPLTVLVNPSCLLRPFVPSLASRDSSSELPVCPLLLAQCALPFIFS